MGEKKQARLVERRHNPSNGGTYEIWDIGDGCGIYVDLNPCPWDTGIPETMAFPYDLRRKKVTSWDGLDVWYEDVHDKPYRYCPNCGCRLVGKVKYVESSK
jgi:hypothetical protein